MLIRLFLHVRPWYRPQGCSEERTKDPVLMQLTLRWREIRIEPTENYVWSVSLLWRKVEKAQGLGRAGEVVYWVVRDGLTDMVTFEGRPEDVRAGAKGCAEGKAGAKALGQALTLEKPQRDQCLGGGMNPVLGGRKKAETEGNPSTLGPGLPAPGPPLPPCPWLKIYKILRACQKSPSLLLKPKSETIASCESPVGSLLNKPQIGVDSHHLSQHHRGASPHCQGAPASRGAAENAAVHRL